MSKHPHILPQQGGSHLLRPDGTLERRHWTIQRGEPGHPETPKPAAPAQGATAAPAAKPKKES